MTAYTNTRDNNVLPGVGFKDGDTLTTVNGSKWIWQNESWFPVMFAGNPDVQPLTASTTSSGGVEFDEPTTTAIAAIAAANGGGAAAPSTDLLKAQHLSSLNEQRATMQRDAYNPIDALILALGRYRPDFGGLLREKLDATWGGAWTFTRAVSRPAPVFLGTVPTNAPAFGLLSGSAPRLAGKKFDLDLFPFGTTLASAER